MDIPRWIANLDEQISNDLKNEDSETVLKAWSELEKFAARARSEYAESVEDSGE